MLKLIETTNADSFDLFYGTGRRFMPSAVIVNLSLSDTPSFFISHFTLHCSLETTGLYKFNRNSMDCIVKLKEAMDDVVGKLLEEEESDAELELKKSCEIQGS